MALALALSAGLSCRKSEPPPQPKPWERPAIIDFHAHLGLDGLDRTVQIMTENNIRLFVNLSGGSFGYGGLSYMEALELQRRLPGRVVNFYNPDWQRYDAADFGELEAKRLERAKKDGFKGVKIAKVLGLGLRDMEHKLVPVDTPKLDALWKKAGELGLPVSIHVGDPKAFWLPPTPDNERYDELHVHPRWSNFGKPGVPTFQELLDAVERVYAKFPGTTFVAVHFGNCAEDLDYVDALLDRRPNLNIDIAARVPEFGRHAPEKVRAFFAKHQDRILFGTDIGIGSDYLMLGSTGEDTAEMKDVRPFYDAHWRYLETADKAMAHPTPIQGRWTVDAASVPCDVLDKVYYKNAERLLGL